MSPPPYLVTLPVYAHGHELVCQEVHSHFYSPAEGSNLLTRRRSCIQAGTGMHQEEQYLVFPCHITAKRAALHSFSHPHG